MLLRRIVDHGGKSGIAAWACGGGNGNEIGYSAKERAAALLTVPGAFRVGNAGAYGLFVVHAVSAAKGNWALTALLKVDLMGAFCVLHGRVGPGLVINHEARSASKGFAALELPKDALVISRATLILCLLSEGLSRIHCHRLANCDRVKWNGKLGTNGDCMTIEAENNIHFRGILLIYLSWYEEYLYDIVS